MEAYEAAIRFRITSLNYLLTLKDTLPAFTVQDTESRIDELESLLDFVTTKGLKHE